MSETVAALVQAHKTSKATPADTVARSFARIRAHNDAAVFISLRDEKTKPIGREGTAASHWILVDFGSVVVHIFTPPEREYYGLEKHWSEAKTILSVQ